MADRYGFGAFVMDTGTRELRRGDQTIPLTPKAFDVLQVLVESGGVVVEKQDLLKGVWPGSFVSDETLTQNIATLRRALGDLAERPQYIVTVPRRGYRFAAAVHGLSAANHVHVLGAAALSRRAALTPAVVFGIAALLIIAGVIGVVRARSAPPSAPVTRFEIAAPPGTVLNPSASHPAVSPDGR